MHSATTKNQFGPVGRRLYGSTQPGGAVLCTRTSPLSPQEIAETVELIAIAREASAPAILPNHLHTRDWESAITVFLALDQRRGRVPVGWKIGAASEEVRRAEQIPEPAPGFIYEGTVFDSPAELPSALFINYRNVECEFGFVLAEGLGVRARPYDEDEVRAAIAYMVPTLELGDMVFQDWYGASGYLGSCLDNGGGAALVRGAPVMEWAQLDLPGTEIQLSINDIYLKSGLGIAAMGHPVTSLTWLANWLRARGRGLRAGDLISTGTCTGHCFAAPGDTVTASFAGIGTVSVTFGLTTASR